jgi:hypothetical protein
MSASASGYRLIPRGLFDDPGFQALSADARWVLISLMVDLHSSGIGVGYTGELVGRLDPRTGLSVRRIRRALGELTASGWVEADGVLVWIRGQLRADPGMSSDNKRHLVAIQRHVSALPDRPIVRRFRAYYHAWFQDDEPDDAPDADEGDLGDSLPDSLSHRVSDHRTRIIDHGTRNTEHGRPTAGQDGGKRGIPEAAEEKKRESGALERQQPAGSRLNWKADGSPPF